MKKILHPYFAKLGLTIIPYVQPRPNSIELMEFGHGAAVNEELQRLQDESIVNPETNSKKTTPIVSAVKPIGEFVNVVTLMLH